VKLTQKVKGIFSINKHMNKLTVAVSVLLITSLCSMSSCGPNRDRRITDYYGEYTFVLPFDHSISNNAGSVYFDTDYSMEQMAELVNEAGYGASLHAIGDAKTILISAQKDGFTYYFVVYDRHYPDFVTSYTLMRAVSGISIEVSNIGPVREPHRYVFLAPLHIMARIDNSDVRRVYGSFEDIAEFYRATGKNDVVIDDANKTVMFWCDGNPNLSWKQGTIIMQYTETESGNYLEIRPLSD
jgi:hypothetical protein